jgi:hypothetical protein
MARKVVVQYKVKADRVSEHEGLIRDVFAELTRAAPAGIRYGAFKRADGVSFVHLAFISAEKNPLDSMPAFRKFSQGIKERCDVPPEVTDLTEVGAFGLG